MKRLAILSVFDPDGIMDRSLLYYAGALLEAVDELVIAVNGEIREDDLLKLKNLTENVIIRDNKGYDVGGYKEASEHLGEEYLLKFDEIVLSNDTNFGPFLSFADIFKTMEENPADFWGMNYEDRGLFGFLDAYFLVFRKETIRELCEYLSALAPDSMSKSEVVHTFEIGLFQHMIRKKFSYDSYTFCEGLNLYSAPNYALREYRLPLMKKRCFEKSWYVRDNCLDCLLYIEKHCDYDTNMILETVKRKYGITYHAKRESEGELKTQRLYFPKTKLNRKTLIELSGQNRKLYIYGTGCYGTTLFSLFRDEIDFDGFVVSDDRYCEGEKMGKPVYQFSAIEREDANVIVALKDASDIKRQLGDRDNVFYLW